MDQMATFDHYMPKIDLSNLSDASHPKFFSRQVVGARRFYSDARSQASHGLKVTSAGVEQVASDYHIARKTFPFYGVEFVASGEGMLNISGNEAVLQSGVVFSYGRSTEHEIRTHPKNRLVKYFVDFEGSSASRLLRQSNLRPGSVMHSASPLEVMSIFDELIRSGLKGTPSSELICHHLLRALLLKIAESAVSPESYQTPAFATYLRIAQDLEAHAREIPSLHALAERCSIDEAYLCRLFKRFDFESPYQKLLRLRMHLAADELLRSAKLIKEVSRAFGFSDQFHFSRTFRSIFGQSPVQWLKSRSHAPA
jgi:AraC-like DNA-binding protein